MRILLTFIIFGSIVQSAASQQLNVKILDGLSSGSAAILAPFFAEEVELILLGNEGNYSKRDAQSTLQAFFDERAVIAFKILHDGSSEGERAYSIGELQTKRAKYRVYVVYKLISPQQIDKIRIGQ